MIDPVAFEIGPLQVHWYGIIIAGAVLIGGLLGTRVAVWLNEDPDDGWSMLLLVMILAVVGVRRVVALGRGGQVPLRRFGIGGGVLFLGFAALGGYRFAPWRGLEVRPFAGFTVRHDRDHRFHDRETSLVGT